MRGKVIFGTLLLLLVGLSAYREPAIYARSLGNGRILLTVRALPVPAPQTGGTPVAPPKTGTVHGNSLSWTASTSSVAGYNVYKSSSSGAEQGTAALNGSTPVAGTAYTDLTVTQGATAYYVVTAVTAGGNQSAWSNEASGTTPTNPAAPTGMGCNSN
jgi:fibronectin type 3 domain-containing protein